MESLGIDLKLLIAQVVNFLILFLVLRKFLYKPILDMLDGRSKKIADGLKCAEESEEKLKSTETEAKKILDKAEKEAKEIRDQAKSDAKQLHDKAITEANTKGEKVIKNAKEEALSLKESALISAKKELSSVISLAMEKVLGNDLDEKSRQTLTAKAINEL